MYYWNNELIYAVWAISIVHMVVQSKMDKMCAEWIMIVPKRLYSYMSKLIVEQSAAIDVITDELCLPFSMQAQQGQTMDETP